ncbi:MAG: bifunctional nuclease family protein [Bacteroidia bacterium]|nr:bifunctional nuclease family protein [Bacteroidia bacterium]
MQDNPEEKIPIQVLGVTDSPRPEMYILLIEEKGGMGRRLPILIGIPEAQAIAVRLHGLRSPRPLSHDLFMTLALSYQIEMIEAIIYKVVNGVFFSQVVCKRDSKVVYIDSRTSDAIALAIRFNAPIYTYDSVFQEASTTSIMAKVVNKLDVTLQDMDSDSLQQLMDKAIEEEDYERAGAIRDILNKRKQ